MSTKNDDDLYVEIEYTPRGAYKWVATLKDNRERITSDASDFKWLIYWYARTMLAAERKKRAQAARAKEIGKVVIR